MSEWETEEWQAIHERRKKAFNITPPADKQSRPNHLIGLALSGGGIRSALYNDGFLQGLSHRGFLRFVDYLASVSGGGYIAGHLIAQAESHDKPKDGTDSPEKPGFHDDEGEPTNPPRWHLGRNPSTGEVDPKRLAAVGGYLSRPLEVLPAYLWSCFFSAAFYIGICGIFATLAALVWRSFDDPTFRILYLDVLGNRIGDEFLIAFIPAIILAVFFIFVEIGLSAIRWAVGSHKRLHRIHLKVRAWTFVISVLAALTSIAIFLGNGTTNVQSGAGGSLYLNHYAQWLAVIAGTLQVLVFFGSDRLFRSERQEAKSWQKLVQRFVAVGVTLFLVFSIIHWMGRENISKYTNHRGPYLVVGDVNDWQTLENVFESYTKSNDQSLLNQIRDYVFARFGLPKDDSLNIADNLPQELRLPDKWEQTLATRRWSMLSNARDSEPLEVAETLEPQPWMLESRLLGAIHAYRLAMQAEKPPHSVPRESRAMDLKYSTASKDSLTALPIGTVVERSFQAIKALQVEQQKRLDKWNKTLDEPEFTQALLSGIFNDDSKTEGKNTTQETLAVRSLSLQPKVKELLASDTIAFSKSQKKAITNAAHRIELLERGLGDNYQLSANDIAVYAEVNRLLLEALFPAAIREKDIPSTYVVPPHDQRARRSWLGFWLLLATIGTIGGVFRHQVATVFHFYRRQLGSNFLVRTHQRSKSMAEVPLHQINPTADGLPYPLMLAASMEPVTVNGGYTIASKTFMFTPKYCGDLDDDHNRIRSKQVALTRGASDAAITLADAVTLSGAAVTAFSTTNRCLSLLVDFFNSSLGMQVYRTEKTDNRSHRPGNIGWLVIIAIAASFATLIYFATYHDWPSTGVAFVLSGIVGSGVMLENGVPHFLKMLMVPREVGPAAAKSTRERSSKSFYVADGGFTDYLGVSALLERRCELIVVSDAGANVGEDHLGTLAKMCEKSAAELGIRFLDLDHEAPIDFGRLQFGEQRLAHQPYLCMRVRYSDAKEGLLIYCQMTISESDPIEIQQIRHRFPTFPDEPTTNQFYTEDQVSAYRLLGYHNASKLCRELERWGIQELAVPVVEEKDSNDIESEKVASYLRALRNQQPDASNSQEMLHCGGPPHFDVLMERLLTAYRLACYEEVSYREDDIFSEAIWPMSKFAFPSFGKHVHTLMLAIEQPQQHYRDSADAPSSWLRLYETHADVRSAYRKAVLEDINVMGIDAESFSALLWFEFLQKSRQFSKSVNITNLWAAHLVAIATACQEVHRGRPHSTFQIGGRMKLIELCIRIASIMMPAQELAISDETPDANLREKFDQVIAEITELERSIFQGGEHVTTISFAQCVAQMCGRITYNRIGSIDTGSVAARARSTFAGKRSGNQLESRMVEVRRELDGGLRTTNMNQVLDALVKLWYLGYFNVEAKENLIANPVTRDLIPDFCQQVSALDSGSGSIASRWLKQVESTELLRDAYQTAVCDDLKTSEIGEKCSSAQMWHKLQAAAQLNHTTIKLEKLLAAHLASIALTCRQLDQTDKDIAFPVANQLQLIAVCQSVAKLIQTSEHKYCDDTKLAETFSAILKKLSRLDKSTEKPWSSLAKASFAYCIAAFWGSLARTEQSLSPQQIEVDIARSVIADSKTVASGELSQLIQRNETQSTIQALMRVWYVHYLKEDDMEPLFGFQSPPIRRSTNTLQSNS